MSPQVTKGGIWTRSGLRGFLYLQTRILQGMNDMRSEFCIFFVYKNLCNILRLYSKSPDLCSHPCCVKNTSLIHIFGFAIAFDSSRCQSICNTVAIG